MMAVGVFHISCQYGVDLAKANSPYEYHRKACLLWLKAKLARTTVSEV